MVLALKDRIIAEYSMRLAAYVAPEFVKNKEQEEFKALRQETLSELEVLVEEFIRVTEEIGNVWLNNQKLSIELKTKVNTLLKNDTLFPEDRKLISSTMYTLKQLLFFSSYTLDKKHSPDFLKNYWRKIDERYVEFLKSHSLYKLSKKLYKKNHLEIA